MTRFKFKRQFTAALIISLATHLLLVLSLNLAKDDSPLRPEKSVTEITLIDADTDRTSKDQQPKQVVQQNDQRINDETPEKAKYLSQHNQTVVKETRAKQTGEFKNQARSGQFGESQTEAAPAQKSLATPLKNTQGDLPSLSDLRPQFENKPPSPEKTQQAQAGAPSQTDDYLKDVETGMQTLLSTKEFVYYSYYERIRHRLRQHWEPSIRRKVEKILSQGRSIASARDRITRVMIVLDKRGSLLRVKVLGQSGLHDLDDAAVDAFRAAEPFPNPPQGIIEQDGTIRIRWDFILEA
ncbi:MAG: energy transducer TonB [Pseudobdellovibrionaceae bacterium]|nr:energy transducer TonB [Bdellovibrionales bacterium]USN47180.1 MAG: energy transducer TonB [Pseudobdellovibrionaceae bacterium]